MKRRVFFDMDGVLCEYHTDATMSDMERDGYFRDLRPRRKMVDAVKLLLRSKQADVYILSSVLPQRKVEATREKNDWLDRYLPEINYEHRLFPVCGSNKADAVDAFSATDVLCDDHSPNLLRWVHAGGKAIKIMNEINGVSGTFQSGPRLVINESNDLLTAILSM